MLEFNLHVPDGVADGAPVLVLLHGRGSNKNDLIQLKGFLPASAIIVTPQAPFSSAQWGYGTGWAWYRYLGGTTPEPETFAEGQNRLAEFIRALPGHLPVAPGNVVIGGFSQGGTTSLAYALRNPGTVAGVIVMSGFLASHPTVRATPETVKGVRFFWGHGTNDPMIPFSDALAGRKALAEAGADLTTRDYPMGHTIAQEELADIRQWLAHTKLA